ncbi:two component transcriptional regulator, LuxR family [Hydrobacter penzbergensis]|uniref:Two component transcriptional regulator, LuxR family n=1 Tax=Hydrobacter penzbergensis TaxID=1235997 RepID=A0A8X8IE36_9BACT|nr:response regulator transcription factor [Hydrobacter penzbergensis]SDW54226.1 two component transcriptional regulator, LuxR family [Hydrobacter penzbergensis]
MIRIVIADDHAVVREGIKRILLEEFPFALIEEVNDTEELIKVIVKGEWDIVICDLSMPGRSGLDALHQIKQIFPKLPVLILSVYPEEQYGIRALKAGAAGYLSKNAAPKELINAIQRTLMGRVFVSPTLAEKLATNLTQESDKYPHEMLSNREFDVFKLISSGKSVSEIAILLSLGITTISTYRVRVLKKMQMNTNAELTRYALENKLI